jgi:hypothetical protein
MSFVAGFKATPNMASISRYVESMSRMDRTSVDSLQGSSLS